MSAVIFLLLILIKFNNASGAGVYAISQNLELIQYDINSGDKTVVSKVSYLLGITHILISVSIGC